MSAKKCCAVCGDIVPLNVRAVWERNSDKQLFSVCLYCVENDLVNATSVDNYPAGHLDHLEPPRTPYNRKVSRRGLVAVKR